MFTMAALKTSELPPNLPNVNSLSFENVEKWFRCLGLVDNHNSLIGVRTAYIVDWNESTVRGISLRGLELILQQRLTVWLELGA
jgi:hypothetical protein